MKIKFEKDVESCQECPLFSSVSNSVKTRYLCHHPYGPRSDLNPCYIDSIHPDCPFLEQECEISTPERDHAIKLLEDLISTLKKSKRVELNDYNHEQGIYEIEPNDLGFRQYKRDGNHAVSFSIRYYMEEKPCIPAKFKCDLCGKEWPITDIQEFWGDGRYLCKTCYSTVSAKVWDEKVNVLADEYIKFG